MSFEPSTYWSTARHLNYHTKEPTMYERHRKNFSYVWLNSANSRNQYKIVKTPLWGEGPIFWAQVRILCMVLRSQKTYLVGDCILRLRSSLIYLIPNSIAKTKLAILGFLCCKEFMKNPIKTLTSTGFMFVIFSHGLRTIIKTETETQCSDHLLHTHTHTRTHPS